MHPVLRLLRPQQWVKNLLVFAAPGAAGRLDELEVVARSILAFVLFCAVSSAGYVRNDMVDVEADRVHPSKRNRPLATGRVSMAAARRLLVLLAVPALAASVVLGANFVATLIAYGAVSALYTASLKRIPWIELVAVSAGFVLRAVGGGTATDTSISAWFLLVVSAGALLVITGKRVGEYMSLGGTSLSRNVLSRYRLDRLRVAAATSATAALVGYVAWAAAEARDRAPDSGGSRWLQLTAIPFGLAIGRYLVLSWRGFGEMPESLLLRDRIMVATGASWMVMYSIGLYL